MEFQKMHENPDVLHVGTCQNRSYFLPKAPEDGEESTRVCLLNGTWSFRYFDSFLDVFPEGSEGEICFDEDKLHAQLTFSIRTAVHAENSGVCRRLSGIREAASGFSVV